MSAIKDVSSALGVVALGATLALLSPGVRAVRADDAAPPADVVAEFEDGPSCDGGVITGADEIVGALDDIQREVALRVQHQPAADGGGFVDLNSRGYNDGAKSLSLPSPAELHTAR